MLFFIFFKISISICDQESGELKEVCVILNQFSWRMGVEFYLYPTVGTVLIHSVKPELTEYRTLSNTVDVQTELCLALMVSIRRIVTYKILINKQLKHISVINRLALFIY